MFSPLFVFGLSSILEFLIFSSSFSNSVSLIFFIKFFLRKLNPTDSRVDNLSAE
nr:MAG TPA: hypothetical protein [Caudoviricetes sp.]